MTTEIADRENAVRKRPRAASYETKDINRNTRENTIQDYDRPSIPVLSVRQAEDAKVPQALIEEWYSVSRKGLTGKYIILLCSSFP